MLGFDDLKRLLAHVTGPSAPTIYRELYGLSPLVPALELKDMEAWCTLPYLLKEHLIARPLKDRSFIPIGEIDHLRPSSGTSGRGPLFSPRTNLRHMEYRRRYHDFKKPILAYGVPAMPHWHEAFGASAVVFDPKEPAVSAKIAREAGVDALSLFAFHVPLVAPHLVREGIAGEIRFIEIAGEACTRALFDYMRETFPNATVLPFYGSSEVEDSPIGMPVRAITGEEPLSLYSAKPSHYHEIIEPETGTVIEPKIGAEGELVITAYPGEPSSFPLVRFRTGDTVRIIDVFDHQWTFTVLGRTQMDFIKLQGGVLHADEIARVLKRMPEDVTDRFELRFEEVPSDTGPLFSPTLSIEVKRELDLSTLAQKIAEGIRVSPTMTYAEGVRAGRYASLKCAPFSPREGVKAKRIVRA